MAPEDNLPELSVWMLSYMSYTIGNGIRQSEQQELEVYPVVEKKDELATLQLNS